MEILRDLTPDPAQAGPDRGVCDSLAVNMAALPVGSGGTGTWSVISGGSSISDIHSPVTRVSNLGFGNNQFRWTVVSQFGICPVSTDNITITRDLAPAPALAGMDQNLCSSVTSPLGANNATAGTATWSVVTNPSGVAPVFVPGISNPNTTVQILAGNEGIYEFAWTIVNGSCRTSDTLRVDFGMPVPPADAGPDAVVCGTSAALNGNSAGIGTGTWHKISGSGATAFLPGEHSQAVFAQINAGEEGSYSYEWRITSGSCPPSADTVDILYKPMPGIPTAADVARCGPGAILLSSVPGTNGDVNRWYENASGGAMLSEGNNYTTPPLTSGADYWVSSFNLATGCESFRRQVQAEIFRIPDAPVVSDIQHCGNASVIINATIGNGGTTNRWYDAAAGGNLLAEAETFTTPLLSAPASYWASSYNDSTGCESIRVRVTVRIDPVPAVPGASDASRCGEGALTLVSTVGANGTRNHWYDAPVGGPVIDTARNFGTPHLTSSVPYWVSSYNEISGCREPKGKGDGRN